MEYRIGDIVKIRSKSWWEENKPPLEEKIKKEKREFVVRLDDYTFDQYGGKIGEVQQTSEDLVKILFEEKENCFQIWTIEKDWIEKRLIKIHLCLKSLKNTL